jgi:hypothetical protein
MTFLSLIQEHYSSPLDAEFLGRDVLSSITPDTEHKKFTASYLSLFWTRKRNIPKEITEYSNKPEYKEKCLKCFTYIAGDISEALEDDFYAKLQELIANDDSISARKKNSLHKTFESGNKGKYLTDVFLYAISKPNKSENIEVGKDDVDLLVEVDQRCPLCNTELIKRVKEKTLYRYTVTRIYPEYLDSSQKDEYDALRPKPSSPDDIINKICLCDECSASYIFNPSIAIYDRLLRIKKQASFGHLVSSLSDNSLDEKIVEILSRLNLIDPDSEPIVSSHMKPIKLVNKIKPDNYLLMKAIRDDNDVYYTFIKEKLSQMDEFKSSFRLIASQVRTTFLTLDNEGKSQNEIYQSIIEWILKKMLLSKDYYAAAHIVVSFFVQSCEVFDEIPE